MSHISSLKEKLYLGLEGKEEMYKENNDKCVCDVTP